MVPLFDEPFLRAQWDAEFRDLSGSPLDLFANCDAHDRVTFRCRDNYSLSEQRVCRLIAPDTAVSWDVQAPASRLNDDATLCLHMRASLDIFDSHAYVGRHINSLLRVCLNDTVLHDGLLHWRSHEETAAFWPVFEFPFKARHLRPGLNRITIRNMTHLDALGEFLDPALQARLPPDILEQKLGRFYLAELTLIADREAPALPRLTGIPRTAIAGVPFILELTREDDDDTPWRWRQTDNATLNDRGDALEFGCRRQLWTITPQQPGQPLRLALQVGDRTLNAVVETVYAARPTGDCLIGPGAETTYWPRLLDAVIDGFEQRHGNCVRISIDDYLNNLHLIPVDQWLPLIDYLVRRDRRFAMQRIRVPPYSRITPEDMQRLADRGGACFAGTSVTEPILHLSRQTNFDGDLADRLADFLTVFRQRLEETRLPGHPVVTFDSAGPICGHYYAAGLDVHLTELGPACNVLEEACCRGAATAFQKPWGIACAMHWYCGQGAHYACDESRVRLARLIMHSSYLAGARQILWEGGVFDNLPVYNFILSEESRRDYERDYSHPVMRSLREQFTELLDVHQAQQLPPPVVRQAVLRGVNDLFHGTYSPVTSRLGDYSMARAWTLLKVFLPHFSFGRHGIDRGRRVRRWYSATPHGAVDIVPAEASADALARYSALYLLGWNTMTDDLHAKLTAYARGGGRLFLSLPHLVGDTRQQLEWRFYRDGDLRELCGLRIRGLGGRIETVRFDDPHLRNRFPDPVTITPENPLFPDITDDIYPVFGHDLTCFGGALDCDGADILAHSQRDEPVVLRHRLGDGEVVLLNTWAHAGRGRMLDLAEGIISAMADETDTGLRIDDPSQRLAWFEYPDRHGRRLFLLNTDWTNAGASLPASVHAPGLSVPVTVTEGRPLQILLRDHDALILDDPLAQIMNLSDDGHTLRVNVATPNARPVLRHHGRIPRQLVVNGGRQGLPTKKRDEV